MLQRSHLYVPTRMIDTLDKVRKEHKFQYRPDALAYILSQFEESRANLLEATYGNILAEPAPIVISGLAGSGKTFTLTKFAKQAAKHYSIIFIDSVSEQKNLNAHKLDAMRAIALSPRPRSFYLITPELDPVSRRLTMKRVFERLSFLQLKGKLKDCVVCVDEANEYSQSKAFLNFIVESRKFTRKVVIVSTDRTLFENICQVMKPLQKSGAN